MSFDKSGSTKHRVLAMRLRVLALALATHSACLVRACSSLNRGAATCCAWLDTLARSCCQGTGQRTSTDAAAHRRVGALIDANTREIAGNTLKATLQARHACSPGGTTSDADQRTEWFAPRCRGISKGLKQLQQSANDMGRRAVSDIPVVHHSRRALRTRVPRGAGRNSN